MDSVGVQTGLEPTAFGDQNDLDDRIESANLVQKNLSNEKTTLRTYYLPRTVRSKKIVNLGKKSLGQRIMWSGLRRHSILSFKKV